MHVTTQTSYRDNFSIIIEIATSFFWVFAFQSIMGVLGNFRFFSRLVRFRYFWIFAADFAVALVRFIFVFFDGFVFGFRVIAVGFLCLFVQTPACVGVPCNSFLKMYWNFFMSDFFKIWRLFELKWIFFIDIDIKIAERVSRVGKKLHNLTNF